MKDVWNSVDRFMDEHHVFGSSTPMGEIEDMLLEMETDEEIYLRKVLKMQGTSFEDELSKAVNEQDRISGLARKNGLQRFEMPYIWADLIPLCEEEPTAERVQILLWLMSGAPLDNTEISDSKRVSVWLDYMETWDYIKDFNAKITELASILNKLESASITYGNGRSDYEKVFNLLCNKGYVENNTDKEILKRNLQDIEISTASIPFMEPIKPLVYYQAFVKYQKKICENDGFIPEIKNLFSSTEYNIAENNGKNYEQYAIYCELFSDLKRCFPEADKKLCDVGFMYLSNLAEWRWKLGLEGYRTDRMSTDIPMPVETIAMRSYTYCFRDFPYEKTGIPLEFFLTPDDKFTELKDRAKGLVADVRFSELEEFSDDPMKYCSRSWDSGLDVVTPPSAVNAAWAFIIEATIEEFDRLLTEKIIGFLSKFMFE